MGNDIAALFVNRLRRSLTDQTLVSRTSTTPPEFLYSYDLPGVARAWVSFNGYVQSNRPCPIYNKSSTVQGVSTNSNIGEYTIEFATSAFANSNYLVTGSVESNSLIPQSAANTFFIKGSGALGISQTTRNVRIQTINTSLSIGHIPAYANRINILVYK